MLSNFNGKIKLTKSELNMLRQYAARNGHAVNQINTLEALFSASIAALSPALQEDMLEFMETGSSPLTR